ncbi:MAG TPA: hypothetical protein VIF82_06180 [Burkholderiaceae bacterium]
MESLTFYFDRNAGKRLPEALKLLKLTDVKTVIHHHSEKRHIGISSSKRNEQLFKPDEKDDKWLEFVGKNGWIVFSQDSKFHKPGYENEIFAIKQFSVGCFYLWGGSSLCEDKAFVFLKARKKIINAIRNTQKPFIYEITKSGNLIRVDMA